MQRAAHCLAARRMNVPPLEQQGKHARYRLAAVPENGLAAVTERFAYALKDGLQSPSTTTMLLRAVRWRIAFAGA